MSEPDARSPLSVAREVLSNWERGDFSAGWELFAEDVEFSTTVPEGEPYMRGRDRMAAWNREFFSHWRDYRIRADSIEEIDPGVVLMSGRQTGIGVESGLQIDERLFIALRLRDGMIVGNHWHVDRRRALERAGVRNPDV